MRSSFFSKGATVLGEAKEAHTALRYAAACQYANIDEQLLRQVDGVAAVLYCLARRPQRR
ncbi:MAG: hypothetical protein DRI90_25720 [Deltaproteobacteria bacterium]|nr:MAG: hypothetical protein DRI90_25720 [Deltaproteobacteria bacterium]